MSDNKNENEFNIRKSTPPPIKKIRNPFDKALIDRLHKPLCSPGMCKIYKKKHTGTFRWDIDQACTLVPADIVACNSQFEPSPDPVLERLAEEATEKFFSQTKVMASPYLETSKKVESILHTSCDASVHINSFIKEEKIVLTREVSAQTVLTLPPELPPEIENILQPFFTFTQMMKGHTIKSKHLKPTPVSQISGLLKVPLPHSGPGTSMDQDISGEYEITANGSLRRKLFFEEHSDMEHDDSEQTDDEIHVDPRPTSSFEAHTPVIFSPDLSRDLVANGMKRTFGTPLKAAPSTNKPCFRNKILDVVDFGETCPFSPIEFTTPKRTEQGSCTSSSLASVSISPVTKITSSDEEKNNFTSPESEAMATCLNCVGTESDGEKKGPCFCRITPNKIALKRSKSLKESPPRSRKGSISEKRSLSMSSLHRSRSVQKLDFSMDMSVDGSIHDNSQDLEYNSVRVKESTWSIVEEAKGNHLVTVDSVKSQVNSIESSTILPHTTILDETPIKGKTKESVRSHEISKIRVAMPLSPLEMSLDSSLDNDNPLSLEDKKIDFNTVDLKFLTENVSQFDYNATNVTKIGEDVTTSFKKVDSGFNEQTFYANASSYYESAIKPSELTVTNISRTNNKTALKEISNVHWMRTDSGFKDETSCDSVFYNTNDAKKFTSFHFSEAKLDNKENAEDFDKFLVQSNKNDAMSMSDIFSEDMTFNCNFSSTPSKNKSRKFNS